MSDTPIQCPHCQNDDSRMIERIEKGKFVWFICGVCSKSFVIKDQ